MQIDRMFKMVYILLNRRQVKARELAEQFEVSVRTIYRDMEALSAAGIPVYTIPGRGGGIALMDTFVLNKSTMSEEEQNHILMALENMAAADYMELDEILGKLKGIFQKNETNWIAVDYSRWGNYHEDKERFEALKMAIINKNVIHFSYVDGVGNKSERKVEPAKLLFKSKSWYMQAYCLTKEAFRTFKLNRMLELKVTEEFFEPKEITLPEPEPEGNCERIILRFSVKSAFRIYDEFKTDDIRKEQDGSFVVMLDAPVDQWMKGYLLSFGNEVEVLEPESLRQEVVKECKKILERYKI